MTFDEIEEKFLFSFCNPGNGSVLVCKVEKEKNTSTHIFPYVINFWSCTDDPEGWDFIDNLFYSYDGVNFEENSYHIKMTKANKKFARNFIRRLFNISIDDGLIKKVLE